MQFIFGSAKAPSVQPVLLSGSNTATEATTTFLWKKDITFNNEDGADRLLVIVYGSEGEFNAFHSTPKYNGISGVRIGSKSATAPAGGGFHTSIISAHYWLESQLPSSDGDFEFQITIAAQFGFGHHARAFLFKNVDQTTPVGTMQTRSQLVGVPTFQVPITASGLQDKAVVLGVQTSVLGPTYVTGDHRDNGSNMEDIIEQQARPATAIFGGGAFASAHDIIPSASEDYIWDIDFGTTTLVQATVSLLVPVNVLP